MSSSQYDQNLPFSELIKTIKYSFRECEFNEVEKVLTDREINMKIEMKNLELENMELVDKLQKSRRKCQELESKNSEHERSMVRVYQDKFKCLDENEKLKVELTELKKQNEKLTTRYNALAQDLKKLDGKLIKALIEAIDEAQMKGYTQAQQQVYETFPKTEKNADENVDELGGERLKQSGSKGLKGSGPSSSTARDITSNIRANKRKRREHSPIRSTTKRKTTSDDSLPIYNKENKPEMNITHTAHCLTYESQITSNCVKELRKFAGIRPEYKIVTPSLEDRPNSPPPGFLCFYRDQVYGGLRFPIPPLFSDIARLFNIPLSQLTPNAFRFISGFAMAVLYLGEKPTARLFHSYFHPRRTDEGFFYFHPRPDVRFLKGYPKSSKVWKKHYYFFISSPQAHPWNFPTIWTDSLPTEEKTQRRSPAFQSLLDRLNQNPYNISRLVDPSLLYHFGLSPRVMTLSKTLDETMAKNLIEEEEALNGPKRRQEKSSDTSSAKVVKEVE